MAAGDTLRRITPNDQLIVDINGNVVGIKNPNANGGDLRFDPSNLVATGGSIGAAVKIGPSLNNYGAANPIYIAHRGAAALYPEESKVAYDNALNDGEVALETDVQTLSGGTLGLMHDSTVDRTTTGTGNVSTFTASTFTALTMDSSVWLGSNYGDTLNPMLYQAYIDAYKGRALLVPEDKDLGSMTALVRALVNSGVPRDQALVQSFSTIGLPTAVAAGYQALGLTSGGSPTAAAIAATGATWASVAAGESIASYVAAGLKTLVYTINRRYLRDPYLTQGAAGFFSDDPTYLRSSTALRTTDLFSYQTWIPGMLAHVSDAGLDLPQRGNFSAPNYWGYSASTAGYYGCLQGYLCPVANPQSLTFTFNLTIDSVNAGDTSRWASVFLGTSDRPFTDSNGVDTGYHFLMRLNGTMGIYKKDSGQNGALLQQVAGPALSTGTEYTVKIVATSAALTLTVLSGASVIATVSATDSSYRGGYIQLGRSGMACRFRTLLVA